jgi:hypothetical protein
MGTVIDDDDDETPRQPRDVLGGFIFITGILCAVLLIVGALGLV